MRCMVSGLLGLVLLLGASGSFAQPETSQAHEFPADYTEGAIYTTSANCDDGAVTLAGYYRDDYDTLIVINIASINARFYKFIAEDKDGNEQYLFYKDEGDVSSVTEMSEAAWAAELAALNAKAYTLSVGPDSAKEIGCTIPPIEFYIVPPKPEGEEI